MSLLTELGRELGAFGPINMALLTELLLSQDSHSIENSGKHDGCLLMFIFGELGEISGQICWDFAQRRPGR
jgi:hypothetical protein